MLGKLSVPRRLTNLDDSRARVGVFLDIFSLIYLFSLLSPSLGVGPI